MGIENRTNCAFRRLGAGRSIAKSVSQERRAGPCTSPGPSLAAFDLLRGPGPSPLRGATVIPRWMIGIAIVLMLCFSYPGANAQSPQQWVEWGDRVHGGFGSLIAYGIRIGLDAMDRLEADRRELEVVYTDGPQAPCPCVIDGVAVAVSASLGQRTLTLEPDRTADGELGRVRFTHKESGRTLTYVLPQSALPLMNAINRDESGVGRLQAVMELDAELLYQVE